MDHDRRESAGKCRTGKQRENRICSDGNRKKSTETKKLVIEDLDDAYEAPAGFLQKNLSGIIGLTKSFLKLGLCQLRKRSSIKYCTGVQEDQNVNVWQ